MILKEPGMKFMGHTVVAGFDKKSSDMINELMRPFNANKIPFGRNCDREAANREMDYHMTVFHWAKSMDSYYLEKIKGFSSEGFDIRISDVYFFPAEEGSFLLCFEACSTDSYCELACRLEEKLDCNISGNLHVTLAVSKSLYDIERIYSHIRNNVTFPFDLHADRLDMYHIWRPTEKVCSF